MELADRVAANIKAARKTRGLSLQKLAAKIEPPTSYQQLSRLEQGRMLTIEWIERIAHALGVEPFQLITGEEQRSPQMSEAVAYDVARAVISIASDGREVGSATVRKLATFQRELHALVERHPQTLTDIAVARPALDLLARREVD